jgi:hypothetical protein
VIGALKPGDTIVKRGSDELRVGSPIEAKAADSAPANAPATTMPMTTPQPAKK